MQKVMRGGQITLPKTIREQLSINEGDFIETRLEGDDIVINVIDLNPQIRILNRA